MEAEDLIVGHVQALVNKIKKLEKDAAQIERLKKYNSDLKKSVEEQAQQILTLKRQNNEDSCEQAKDIPLIDISQEDEKAIKGPLEIPEVLQLVFRHMDKSNILKSRLVSKFWNNSGIAVIKLYHLPVFRMISEELDETGDGIPNSHVVKTLEKFDSLLQHSNSPEFLIKKLVTNGRTLSLLAPQSFLKEYGRNITSICIEDCRVNMSLFKSLLTVWCTELIDLEIQNLQTFRRNEDVDKLGNFSLRLESLTIESSTVSNDVIKSRNINLIMDVLKSSLHLKYLKMYGNEDVSNGVLRRLKKHPEVSKNYQDIWITAGDGDVSVSNPLKRFLDLQVLDNLKALTLSFEESLIKIEFISILCKLSRQLECLTVLRSDYGFQESNVKLGKDLPLLPQLKVCKYLANKWSPLKYRDILLKMPKLEKLILAGNYDDFEYNVEFKTDEFFSNANEVPHNNLKQLLMAGTIKDSMTTIILSKLFPHLEKLYVCIEISSIMTYSDEVDFLHARNSEVKNSQIKSLFEGMANLKQLKKLFISFESYEWPANLDYVTAFELLATLPCLHTLVLINGDDGGFPTVNFTEAVLTLLRKCKGLRVLELVNFKMRLPDTNILLSQLDSGSSKLLKFKDRLSIEDLVAWIIQKF